MNIPFDKLLHFAVCFAISLLLFPVIGWWGIGTAIATGVGKELYDWRDYGTFSWGDIFADVLGVLIAMLIIILIKIL